MGQKSNDPELSLREWGKKIEDNSYILPTLNSLFHIHASDGNTILRHYILLNTTEIVQNPLPKSHNTEVFLKTMNFCVITIFCNGSSEPSLFPANIL